MPYSSSKLLVAFFFFKQKPAYEILAWLEFRRVLFRSDIPAGVADGMELRVAGNGHAGVAGGSAGDLFVRIEVEPSPAFERRGQELFAVLDVSITQATLGAELEIEGLDAVERITVEPGTESGTVIRLKGKGVPNLNRHGRGDMFVTLHVVTPRDLSRVERDLLARLAELRGEH